MRQSLSTTVATDLRKMILAKKLQPGDQIGIEAQLCADYQVSRTVVREAIASLRSEGLLVSRQGLGVFVAEQPVANRFEVDWDSIQTLPKTLEFLELRMAVEVESAGLCAARRSATDAKTIRKLMNRLDSQQLDPDSVEVFYDFEFHLAIAKGAKNFYLHQFLSFLAPSIEPHFKLGTLVSRNDQDEYYERIHKEHDAIVTAIDEKDERKAREAMRTHLVNSLQRLRDLASAYGLPTPSGSMQEQGGSDPAAMGSWVRKMIKKAPAQQARKAAAPSDAD